MIGLLFFIFILLIIILGIFRLYASYKEDVNNITDKPITIPTPDQPTSSPTPDQPTSSPTPDQPSTSPTPKSPTTTPKPPTFIPPEEPRDPGVPPPYEKPTFECPVDRQPPCKAGYYPDVIKTSGETCCFLQIDMSNPTLLEKLLTDPEFQTWIIANLGMAFVIDKLADLADKPAMKKIVQNLVEKGAKEAAEKVAQQAAKEAVEELIEKQGVKATKEAIEKVGKEAFEKAYKEALEKAIQENMDKFAKDLAKYGNKADDVAKNILKNVGKAQDIVIRNAGEIAAKATKTVTEILPKISAKLDNLLKTVLSKLGAKATTVAAKMSTRVAVKVGTSLGIRIGTKVGMMAAKLAVKTGMGPVGWALMVFDIVSIGLDIADPGGYSQVTLQDAYDEIKNKTRDVLKNTFEKEGMKWPPIVGPKTRLKLSAEEVNNTITMLVTGEVDTFKETNPNATEEQITAKRNERQNHYNNQMKTDEGIIVITISKFTIDYVTTEINKYVESIQNKEELTEQELTNLIEGKANQLVQFLESTSGEAMMNKNLCVNNGGVYLEASGECTYKNREDCYAHHSWPLKKNAAGEPDEMTTVYRDGKCFLSGQDRLRETCEGNGLVYDKDKEECIITDVYCMSKGMDYKGDGTRGNCEVKPGQFIAELIFGETITRGLKQVFDPAQYEKCNSDEVDLYNDTPDWFRDIVLPMLRALQYFIPPLQPFIKFYDMAGNKMCLKKGFSCPKIGPLQMEKGGGALCYVPCDKTDGALSDPHKDVSTQWKSDGETVCYKQYPAWESHSGQGHSLTSITKRIITSPIATPLTECPGGFTKRGAVCYRNCPDPEPDGSYWESDGTHGCYKRPKTWPGTISITHLQHDTKYSPAKPIDTCPPNNEKNGALCYPKCNAGYTGVGPVCWGTCGDKIDAGALCRERCRAGWYEVAGVCWENTPSTHVDVGALLREKCRADHYDVAGVCWQNTPSTHIDVGALIREKCKSGYTDVAGVCWENVPAGWSNQGALIRENCRGGYTDVAGVCWENVPGGWSNQGALIRENCRGGYYDVAGVCWAHCNAGYDNDGAFCRRNPHGYGKGCCCVKACNPYGGGCSDNGCCSGRCPSDYREDPCSCFRDAHIYGKHSYVPTTRAKSSYVPTTRTRHSYVPSTTPRPSYVPPTRARSSYVPATTPKPSYGRGAGSPLECAPGREMRGALCYDNCAVHNSGTTKYERRNDNLEFCSTACPGGDYKNIGIGGCQRPRWHAGSTSMICPADKVQYGTSLGLCYQDCNITAGVADMKNGQVVKKPGMESINYTMQSAGLCSQECPKGVLMDFGVGCTRQQFNRGVGSPGWSMRFKNRKVPYGTKK
jgi:hypothetical protein